MSTTLDVDDIIRQAGPVLHQHGQEIQPFGHLVKLPIALAESACKESVSNLNQLLADTMTLRDLYKKHHWQVLGTRSTSCTCCSISTTRSRTSWWTRSPSGFSCWAG